MDTAAKLRYAELRGQGGELPEIARAMNLPEDVLQNFSREMELEGLDSQRIFWEMEQNSPVFDLKAAEIDLKALWNEKDIEEFKNTWETSLNEISSGLWVPGPCPKCGFEPGAKTEENLTKRKSARRKG